MSAFLLNLADYLAEEMQKEKCIGCKYFLKYINVRDGLLIFNSLDWNKKLWERVWRGFSQKIWKHNRFCDSDINKLLRWKGIYKWVYMIVGKDSIKHYCQRRKKFTVTWP